MWWMLVTFIAPELILGLAAAKFGNALESQKMLKELAVIDSIKWTLKHAFFANMGGFAIKVKLSTEKNQSSTLQKDEVIISNRERPLSPLPSELPRTKNKVNTSDISIPVNAFSSYSSDEIEPLQNDETTLLQNKTSQITSG